MTYYEKLQVIDGFIVLISVFSRLMSVITIGTPFNIDLEFRIAAFGRRFMAWLVDIVIICLYYYLMLRFIYPLLRDRENGLTTAALLFVIVIPVLLYQLLFELFFNGQTLGKMALAVKVIDTEGREPTWGQYIIRWMLCLGNLFLYIVPYLILQSPIAMVGFMVLYLPDFICMMVSARSQRIGDLAAGTVVIDKNYKASIHETIYLEIEDTHYQPVFTQVMRLNDRDINGIRNLINVQKPGKDTEVYTQQVVDKIKTVLNIESYLDGRDFLEQLLRDYNYYTTKGPKA
jgi:uncharacterized RDD family membrane protein YckC